MLAAQEAARRIGRDADPSDWERDARRIAAEMQWHGGEPGPLFDASRERLALLSPEGRFLFVGDRAIELLGSVGVGLVGSLLEERMPEVAALLAPGLRRAASGGIAKGESWFELPDGQLTHATYVMVPVWRDGKVRAVLVVGIDTTAKRRVPGEGEVPAKITRS